MHIRHEHQDPAMQASHPSALKPRLTERVKTADGFHLRTVVHTASARPNKGTVIILQGRNETIEKYGRIIADMTARGFDTVAFDWRGQGGSDRFFRDGRRGHVDHFDQYADDLETVFTQIALPEARPPYFLLGHSTGALIALHGAPRLLNRLNRMVLVSPLLSLAERSFSTTSMNVLASLLCFAGLDKAYVGGGPRGSNGYTFVNNRLTTDYDTFEHNRALLDPEQGLGLGGPTAGWVRAATEAMLQVHEPDHLARIHIPTLLIGGGADRLVSTASIEDYARRLRSGALVMIDGARHELMQESRYYRNQFLAAFDAFVPGSN